MPIASDSISFKNKTIFGNGIPRSTKGDACNVLRLLSSGHLSFDGIIEESYATNKNSKSNLWLYLRYIWIYNHMKPSFADDFKFANGTHLQQGHLSARGLVAHVLGVQPQDVTEAAAQSITSEKLIAYINGLLRKHSGDIVDIPFLQSILKAVLVKLDGLPTNNNTNGQMMTAQKFTPTTVPIKVNYYSDVNSSGTPIVKEEQQSEAQLDLSSGKFSVSIKV